MIFGGNGRFAAAARLFMLLTLAAFMAACDNGVPSTTSTPAPAPTTTLSLTTPGLTVLPSATVQHGATAAPAAQNSATFAPVASPTQEPASGEKPTATLMPLSKRTEEFEQVWNTVKEHYLYTDFRGLDWDQIRHEYEQKVAKAATEDEFYATISEMVGLLKDQHSRFISPVEAEDEDHLNKGDTSYAGVGILSKVQDNSSMVVLVFPGSPAEEAGLKRRDRVLAIDGNPVGGGDLDPIRGPAGTQVRLTIKSPGETQRDVTLTRRTVTGKITASSTRLAIDSRIGYLLIPSLWADDMSEQVEQQLTSLLAGPPLKGIVIDLRSNEGGWRTVLTGILGQFAQGDVGYFYSQENNSPLKPDPGTLYSQLRNMPLVVLVDGNSQSYAEVLSAALQVSGHAKVVGTKSAGNTETIYAYNFADGSRLWVAQEGYKLPNGTNLEGRGVIPDVTIDVDWTQYSLEKDPQVLKAVELLTR